MSFAHLTIITRDVKKTAAFFENTMGWAKVSAPVNTPIQTAWIQLAPGQQIHILQIDDFEASRFEEEFGRHFAVFHPIADFPSVKQRLSAHGAKLFDPIRPTPFDRFFFKDPNGYMFEVIAREEYVVE